MNGKVGALLNNPSMGSALSLLGIGALGAVIIGATG